MKPSALHVGAVSPVFEMHFHDVPITEVEWLITRESFPASFVSLAVKGSKLETEMMENLAFWLSESRWLRGWEQRAQQVAVAGPAGSGRKGSDARD